MPVSGQIGNGRKPDDKKRQIKNKTLCYTESYTQQYWTLRGENLGAIKMPEYGKAYDQIKPFYHAPNAAHSVGPVCRRTEPIRCRRAR